MKVSVIIPVFNGEKYVSDAIESVLSQTYSNWELIIIDDGSTDNTASIVNRYSCDNIHYIYQTNQGPAAARNKGIDMAKGEFIAFLDVDDIYYNNKLEEQLDFLKQNDVDVVYNDIEVVDRSLNHLFFLNCETPYLAREDFLATLLFRQILPLPPSIMLRRECLDTGIRYNENYIHAEDYDLTIRLAMNYKFGYLPKVLYKYRRHEGNLTNSHQKQLQAEIKITKALGLSTIIDLVEESNFTIDEKKVLLAKVYIKLKQYHLAEQVLLGVYGEYGKNPLINFYLGNTCYYLNKKNEAKQYFQTAIEHQNDLAEAYNNLGCVFVNEADYGKAYSYFETALSLRPEYMDAKANMKELNGEQSNWKLTNRELRQKLTLYR